MEYQLVLSPDIDLSPSDIQAAWEADTHARMVATVKIVASTSRTLDPTIVEGIVTFVSTVAAGVLTNLLTDVLKDALEKKSGAKGQHTRKHLKITAHQQPGGAQVLVVEQDAGT